MDQKLSALMKCLAKVKTMLKFCALREFISSPAISQEKGHFAWENKPFAHRMRSAAPETKRAHLSQGFIVLN